MDTYTEVSTCVLDPKHEFSITGICLGLYGKFTFWTWHVSGGLCKRPYKKSFFYFLIILKKILFTADPGPNIKVKVIFCNIDLLFKREKNLFLKDAIYSTESTLSNTTIFFTFHPGQNF